MGRNMFLTMVQFILAAALADRATANYIPKTPYLTTSGGAFVEQKQTTTLNSRLLSNEYFVDSITHFVRERIPERVVHAKGAGGFGYFTVTNDISSICKAKFLSEVGKTTPIVIRFSPSFTERGGLDTVRESRGFAVKFYTEAGNFDIVGFNTPMFPIKDPALFPSLIHAAKPSPLNHLPDANFIWDSLTQLPESLHIFFLLFGDRGIPDGYRHMPGFGIHTFQVVNGHGVSSFVRFHMMPDEGIKNLTTEEAAAIGGTDPDYATRDLYTAIENGNFPSWTLSVQILSMEDVKNAPFDVFDITKVLPLDQYPLTEVGRFVLNRNPSNYFASMEQVAFCPGNLVPGILGAPDIMFEARRFSYRDAQNYRLGGNFQNIEVNRAVYEANSYTRDGLPPINANGGSGPNYYPNSFNGSAPYIDNNSSELLKIYEDEPNNFEQMTNHYLYEMEEDERVRFVQNVVASLSNAAKFLQKRAVQVYSTIHPELGSRIQQALSEN